MVSVTSSWLYCLSLLSLFPFISSSITIPLQYPQTNQIPFQDQYQKLNHLVTTSLARARHLKNPQPTPAATATAPLFSHSYGGYSISLSFGTPPQTLSFIMDTLEVTLCSSLAPLATVFDDDTKKSSSLVLDIEQLDSGKKTNALVYTPFMKNPKVEDKSSFSVYYYLGLRRITIGGHHVKMPYKYLSPGEDGNGGVIIDSATTFTFIAREAFEPLSDEFIRQITDYKRIKEFEDVVGLGPCFNVSDAKTSVVSRAEVVF
ncbi:hypothetical protein OIU76_025115 [Salix suchowensis]|nr:hypothetical protein OIU76_025115 [Salix suchowensis]